MKIQLIGRGLRDVNEGLGRFLVKRGKALQAEDAAIDLQEPVDESLEQEDRKERKRRKYKRRDITAED